MKLLRRRGRQTVDTRWAYYDRPPPRDSHSITDPLTRAEWAAEDEGRLVEVVVVTGDVL